ncbi:MAG: C40 family peptidase [Vulcanimicrobiaceae bacterium]
MRQAFAAGAFALLLIGSFGAARANEPTHHSSTYTHAAVTKTSAQPVSPDVTAWTAHLLVVTNAAHRAKDGKISQFAGGVLARTSKIAQELTKSALRFLGTPYVFGGTTSSGFDCSGYVQHVFAMLGISLPRTADAQYDVGHRIVGAMRPGDLVFFQTYEPGVSHVGIYLGNGKFVHASSHGVMISSLSQSYWASRYVGAKRLIATR